MPRLRTAVPSGAGETSPGHGRSRGARATAVLALVALAPLALPNCGARTGLPVPDPVVEEPPLSPSARCISFRATGRLEPLDLVIMIDSSGSMSQTVAGQLSKWDAVVAALDFFFYDAGSTGLGVSLSYFPVIDNAVPDLCTGNANACGDPAFCIGQSQCGWSGPVCLTDADCDAQGLPNEPCLPIGQCDNAPNIFCMDGTGNDCPPGGTCVDYGYCENKYSCTSAAYETPVVAMDDLPNGASLLIGSLEFQGQEGLTPTLPAVVGAVEQARLNEIARQRKTVVLLATDGFPTACDPTVAGGYYSPEAIDNVAMAAANGVENGVQTFVIGVFDGEEAGEAQVNLDQIAAAGGSEEALLVTTDTNLQSSFQKALTEVRVKATPCEYTLPPEVDAVAWEDSKVLVDPGAKTPPFQLQRLTSASECQAEQLAFFPIMGPDGRERLELCPSTCVWLGNIEETPLEITVGCPDIPIEDAKME